MQGQNNHHNQRRNFLKQTAMGFTGGLLAAGNTIALANTQVQKPDDSLKIVKVEPFLLTGLRASAPWVFVRVETADGYVGWGEGTNYPGVRPIATAVTTLSSVIIGQSAWNIEALWQRMYRFMYYNGMGGIVLAAISGIDMALYDIVGKKLGVPVYKLLGGQVHEKLRTYANGWTEDLPHTPEAYATKTKELVSRGYTGCKLDPFFNTPMNREVTQADLRLAAAIIKAIREAGGPDYDIAIDVHGRWNTKSTLEIIRALEPHRLFFYEEAVPPENVAAMAEVQRNTQTPLATGERIFGRQGFRELLEKQAVRVIQPDLARTGGITETKKIASMADTYYVPVAPHNPNGPLCTLASMHVCFSIPNFLILEYFEKDEPIFQDLIPGGLKRDVQGVYPTTAPGLGASVTEDFLKKYKFDATKTDEMERRTFNTVK
ncbi:MAG TPA: mandelate racemase/muconate lactonizing enzyme family protein [Blastocatellia bacterium]|nr:mandelate racemase/muconate lactonizing enzyme family protein [Blastocatellia bacterium]